MGDLALNIETASSFIEPLGGANDMRYFELLAVAIGYRDEEEDIETDGVFRQRGSDEEFTAELLERINAWCRGHEIEGTQTCNSKWFDRPNLDSCASGSRHRACFRTPRR